MTRLLGFHMWAVLITAAIWQPICAQSYDYWRPMLHAEALMDTLPGHVQRFSSWDRGGGNDDAGRYYGLDANGWRILCDVTGPGVLSEFWWTRSNPSSDWRCRIYIGDTLNPDLDVVLNDLCGDTPPFLPPLADSSAGANYSYVPLPFQSRLRITFSGPGPIYYHATVHRLPAGTMVEDMMFPPSPAYGIKLDSLAEVFANPLRQAYAEHEAHLEATQVNVTAGQTVTLFEHHGPGVYRRLYFNLADRMQLIMEKVWVRVYTDHCPFPDLEAPVSSFFGAALGWRPYRSAVSGMTGDSMYFNLPIAFRSHCRIDVYNGTVVTEAVRAYAERVDLSADEQAPMMLRAMYRESIPVIRWHGHEMADFAGRGTFLGVLLDMQSINLLALEGDEAIAFDGEAFPSWQGTGTEDYFNGGYYWTMPSQLAFHGCIHRDNSKAAAYRWNMSDPVAFRNGLRMRIEAGPFNDLSGNYRSFALAYVVPERWRVRDQSEDGISYPAEPIRIYGRGLTPGAQISEVRLGAEPMDVLFGSGTVTADSIIEITVAAPASPAAGTYPLRVTLNGQEHEVRAAWPHANRLQLVFRLRRDEPDTLVAAGDTLDVEIAGIPPGQSAMVSAAGISLPWVGNPPVADPIARTRGTVRVPEGIDLGDHVLSAQWAGIPDAESASPLKVRNFTRLEVEAMPRVSWQGSSDATEYVTGYLPPGADEPWGRNLARRLAGIQAGDYIQLGFSVAVSDTYRIAHFFGRSGRGAIVQANVDGALSLAAYDTYAPALDWRYTRSDTVYGNELVLAAGAHMMRFEIIGRNPANGVAWDLIMDQVMIERIVSAADLPVAQVTDLTIEPTGDGVELRWTRVNENSQGEPVVVDGYAVYRAIGGGTYESLGVVAPVDTVFVDGPLLSGSAVFYDVRPVLNGTMSN